MGPGESENESDQSLCGKISICSICHYVEVSNAMNLLHSKELDKVDYRAEFRPDIQAVRALAVVLVVLYHANIPGIHGGFLGVDVFFVVSGFVITNVLLREQASQGTTSIPGFYARRIRRILPAATIVLIATIFATYHWLSYILGAINANDAKYVAAFVGNFHFATVGTQYFNAHQPPSTLQQFWSLAVEEQFYLVWPVLFLVLTLPWRAFSSVGRLVSVLTLIIGVSLAWCIIETRQNEIWAFFSPLTHAWELALGALLAVIGPHLRGRSPRVGMVLAAIGVVAVLLSTWFNTSSTLWPGTAVIVPVVATGMIIAGGSLRGPDSFGPFARFAPIQWVGNISYSLYLVHWPVIVIATQYAITPLPLHSEIELVALSVVLSAVLYYAIENPIRRSRWLADRRLVTFAFGALLIGLSFAAIYWHLSHY
jgi:peptidoglycan/LPS O-acetylase OafA/YrhL